VESRFWDSVKKCSAEVSTWPDWKKAGVTAYKAMDAVAKVTAPPTAYVLVCGSRIFGIFSDIDDAVEKVAELAETTVTHVTTTNAYNGDILCHQSNGYLLARLVKTRSYM